MSSPAAAGGRAGGEPDRPRRVVVTGAGAVSPFGIGLGALLEGILAGRSAVAALPPGKPAAPGTAIAPALAARVRQAIEPGRLSPSSWRRLDRCSRMAAVAASEALALTDGGTAAGGDGCGMALGTMGAGVEPLREFLTPLFRDGPDAVSPMIFPSTLPSAPASQCSILLGLRGPHLTVCQMEASGLGAIATAVSILESGAAEAMIAGGVDELPAEVERAWRRWGILARGEAAEFRGPFDRRRRGFAPGEGAYVLLLETLDAAHRRGAAAWAEVAGAAMAHARGAPHRWPEEPDVVARSMTLALQRAGLAASEIGYVAASADGAVELDAVEARALRAALGAGRRRVPVSAIKGAVGESGAASAGAAVLAALSIRDGFIPPIAALVDPDHDLGLGLVVGVPRRQPVPSVLVSALGTGGSCVGVVLSRPRG